MENHAHSHFTEPCTFICCFICNAASATHILIASKILITSQIRITSQILNSRCHFTFIAQIPFGYDRIIRKIDDGVEKVK